MSIGDALAEARSRAGLTITQVSQRTCIRETIIRGIERGDFSACGGDFYARGHIRSIARAVGAESDDLIREYDAEHGSPQAIRAADVFEPATPIKIKERRSPNWSVAMVLVLAGVVGFGVYHVVGAHRSAIGQSAQVHHSRSRPAAAASASAAPSDAIVAPHRHVVVIQATAIQACYVEFVRPNGHVVTHEYMPAGSSGTWRFKHTIRMQMGNPAGIRLTVNGRHLGQPGSGQPLTLTLGPGRKLPGQNG